MLNLKYTHIIFNSTMPNYSNGKIYKLSSPKTDMIYIGSTTMNLNRRLSVHKSMCKRYENGIGQYLSACKIYAVDKNPNIELIQLFPCLNRKQLDKQEGIVIQKHKAKCCNHNIPSRSQKDYQLLNKASIRAYHQRYYLKNRVKIMNQQLTYYHKKNSPSLRKQRAMIAGFRRSSFGELCSMYKSIL